MKPENMQDTLSHISDKHIAEAASYKKRSYAPYFRAIAACLAVVLAVGGLWLALSGRETAPNVTMEGPPATQPPTEPPTEFPVPPELKEIGFVPETVLPERLLAAPEYPRLAEFPTDMTDYDAWAKLHSNWSSARRQLHNAPIGFADSINGFWSQSIPEYLSDNAGTNAVYSPVSLYMALSILAQCTEGSSRQEILDLLGAESMEELSEQASLVFENLYENDGTHTSILANSLWLDDAYEFKQDAVRDISDIFYASVYQGALETPEMNIALKDWLNAQTGGLLEDSIAQLDAMDLQTALVIASTINYRCKWANSFNPDRNTQGDFDSPTGKQTVTYMNGSAQYSPYFWGEDFSATYLTLDDGNRMWLILPDESHTPEDLLNSGNAIDMVVNYAVYGESSKLPIYPDQKSVTVNLTVPKFDISADLDLMTGLNKLGVTRVMTPDQANFGGITPYDQQLYLGSANQGVRVAIDENGLIGVAYTILGVPGAGSPPPEEVDLVLDRPFLFVVESACGVPMFTGIVNNP